MKKLFATLFVLTVFIAFASAQDAAKADTFPPGFGKGKTFLYVLTEPGYFQANHALKKTIEKMYKGDYEIVDSREFKVAKKTGVAIYIFDMIYDGQPGRFTSGGRVGPETNYSCGVTDAATGKLYRLPYEGGSYKKVMEKYIGRLEEIRKTNQ